MKDAYSFDLDYEGAKRSYNKMFISYLRTFAQLGLQAIPMRADTGPIGGDLSHEFIILAGTGESAVYCDRALIERDALADAIDYDADLSPEVESWTRHYAATDEKHDPAAAAALGDRLVEARGIEVGHIFYFGTKYSRPMGAAVRGPDDEEIHLEMGSYGIGVSRLVGAVIEAHHDDAGIKWPESVAPFKVGLINLKVGDAGCDDACAALYAKLNDAGVETLLDDREDRAGAKFADMDLIGLPWQLVVGPRGIGNGVVELRRRDSSARAEISGESALARLIP